MASFDYPVEKATLSSSSGLAAVLQKGGSEQQLLQHGAEFGFTCVCVKQSTLQGHFLIVDEKLEDVGMG